LPFCLFARRLLSSLGLVLTRCLALLRRRLRNNTSVLPFPFPSFRDCKRDHRCCRLSNELALESLFAAIPPRGKTLFLLPPLLLLLLQLLLPSVVSRVRDCSSRCGGRRSCVVLVVLLLLVVVAPHLLVNAVGSSLRWRLKTVAATTAAAV